MVALKKLAHFFNKIFSRNISKKLLSDRKIMKKKCFKKSKICAFFKFVAFFWLIFVKKQKGKLKKMNVHV